MQHCNNENKVTKKVLEHIEKTFNEAMKTKERDLFIESVSQQQLFYVFLCDTYGLK